MSELERVRHNAARLLREMARDFDEHAYHGEDCPAHEKGEEWCICGAAAARERWRLPE